MKNLPRNQIHPSSPLAKLLAFIVTLSLAILVLMFSAVVFVVLLIAGVIGWGFIWWKTRALRQRMREFSHQSVMREGEATEEEVFKGEIIEGEVIHVDDTTNSR
jgi:hypothetical protein